MINEFDCAKESTGNFKIHREAMQGFNVRRGGDSMTLVNAICELMGKGITKFAGFAVSGGSAQAALENALSIEENNRRFMERGTGNAEHDRERRQHIIDHADNYFIIEINGRHIIAKRYVSKDGSSFHMATYGEYETDKEMYADFDAWRIAKDAAEIAAEWEQKYPNKYPRAVWLALATSELKAAYAAANAAFERDFGKAANG